jgi:DDE superfamily endonuclease
LPKKGDLSVGVARQYCGAVGKRANCQSLVSLTLAQGEVPLPVALRLFLPDKWRRLSWRQGTKGALAARFAALRVRVGDGAVTRPSRHLPGDEAWLVGEWRSSGERKYYLTK